MLMVEHQKQCQLNWLQVQPVQLAKTLLKIKNKFTFCSNIEPIVFMDLCKFVLPKIF